MNIHDPQAVAPEPAGGAPSTASQAALEEQIAKFFAETFGVEHVGPNEDFFDLGGDSLLGESLAASISQFIDREFQISLLASRSTPRKIASYVLSQSSEISAPAPGKRPPIFMVHGLLGFMLPRPEFLAGLAPGQKLVMFELPGIRGDREPFNSVEEIAAEYIRQLEAEHPAGPVLLGGYCGGCIITLEMAAQLADKGRPVLQMALFDPGGIPRNVLDNFRRNLARKRGEPVERERGTRLLKQQLRYLRHYLLLGRWTDGTLDEDFADERLRSVRQRRLSIKMWYDRLRRARREQDIADNLSSEARAKMIAAFQHYKPRKFEGPVTVYCSEELSHYFESDKAMWVHLLPNRKLHLLGETHSDVIQAQAATGGRLMQEVFDKALAAR